MNIRNLVSQRSGVLAPALVVAAFCVVATWTFYPGFMSFDSLDQYRQVIGARPQTDAHPPIMVYLWRVIASVLPGAGGILIFHQVVYGIGLVLFAVGLTESVRLRVAFVAFMGVWPPLAIHMLHIWKDAGLLAAFTLAIGALMAHQRKQHWLLLVVAALGLLYGGAVRHNALPAALPLWVWWALEFLRVRAGDNLSAVVRIVSVRFVAALAMGIALTMGSYLVASLSSAGLPHTPVASWIQHWDLVGMSVRRGANYVPEYMQVRDTSRPLVDQLRERFVLTNPLATANVVSFSPPPGMESQLTRDWLAAIRYDSAAYVGYRWDLYAVLLGLSVVHTYYPFTPGIDPNDWGFAFAHIDAATQAEIMKVFNWIADLPIYRGWFYLALSIALLGYVVYLVVKGRLTSENFAAAMLVGSSFGVFIPLFVFAPAPDFRYLLWTIMASLAAVCVFAKAHYSRRTH